MEGQEETKQQQKTKKRQNKQDFNPERAPLYMGIFVDDFEDSKKQVLKYTEQVFEVLKKEFSEDQQIQQEGTDILSQFKYPQSHHITSFFAGGKPSNEIYYTNFAEGLKIDIEVACVAYIPGNIICGACFPDQNQIDIANKIPHLTMMVNKLPPKASNNVLESLFAFKESPLQKKYESGEISKEGQAFVKKFEQVDIEDVGKFDIFVVKLEKHLVLPATTKAHFGGGGGKKNFNKGGNKGKNKNH